MPSHTLVDLDQRPDLLPRTLALFAAAPPGRDHVVCGIPSRVGLPPAAEDLRRCLGVLVVVDGGKPTAALGMCSYSEEQVTLWGPVVAAGANRPVLGSLLLREARPALRDGGFESVRALADTRNRAMRSFLLSQGLAAWKDFHLYQRALAKGLPAVAEVRPAQRRDHATIAAILVEAFPDTPHCQPSLTAREREGYRHYVLDQPGGPAAVAAVQDGGPRSWLKLIASRRDQRGKGLAQRLLAGVLNAEAALGHRALGLEVLGDNAAAIAAFEGAGFAREWTAAILTGPV